MTSGAVWPVRALLTLLPAALIAVAIPHLIDGMAIESAFPVPVYLQMNAVQTHQAYVDASDALSRGSAADGDRAILEAESKVLAGADKSATLATLRNGLSRSPATARGWTLLAEQLASSDRRGAGQVLAIALMLAPNDYFLTCRLIRDAGALWDVLPDDARRIAISEAPAMWKTPDFRPYIRAVLATKSGPKLMTEAFRLEPDELRAMNRWVAEQRLEELAR